MLKYELHKNAGTVNYKDWRDQRGIVIPVFDVDGTLTDHRSLDLEKAVIDGLLGQKFNTIFSKVGIASNNPDVKHVEQIANDLVSVLEIDEAYIASVGLGLAGKPFREQGYKIAEHFNVEPEHLGIVGDRWISDVLFARNLGAGAVALCTQIGRDDARGVPTVRALEKVVVGIEKLIGRTH